MFVVQGIIGTDAVILDRELVWKEPWRLATSIFAHGSIGHLLSNLFALGLFGLILEGRIGPKKVLWLFLVSGFAINLFTPYPRSLGASGAIYAIIGALAALRPLMIVWVNMLPLPMFVAGILWFLQDVLGLFVPSGVGRLAHIGGIFVGFGAGLWWRKRYGDRIGRERKEFFPEIERSLDEWEEQYVR